MILLVRANVGRDEREQPFDSGIDDSTWTQETRSPSVEARPMYQRRSGAPLARSSKAMGQPDHQVGFTLTLQPQMLDLPLRWRRPRTIFANSMSDRFHDDVPLAYNLRVFDVMRRASWHRFQD